MAILGTEGTITWDQADGVARLVRATGGLAELVCSNSFRSDDDESNAVGLLHWEMRQAGGLIISSGDAHRLPAGGALAVDRNGFSAAISEKLSQHPLGTVERGEISGLPPAGWSSVIVATREVTRIV